MDKRGSYNVLFLSRYTEGLRHSMEKWKIVEKTMGNRSQRKDVDKNEKYDGTCEVCCDAGRGTIEGCGFFCKELHRDVCHHLICSIYMSAT